MAIDLIDAINVACLVLMDDQECEVEFGSSESTGLKTVLLFDGEDDPFVMRQQQVELSEGICKAVGQRQGSGEDEEVELELFIAVPATEELVATS